MRIVHGQNDMLAPVADAVLRGTGPRGVELIGELG